MPDLSALENEAMQKLFEKYNLREESIRPDGNCLYAAFATQLSNSNNVPLLTFIFILYLHIAGLQVPSKHSGFIYSFK
jgi:hypothetical protein